MTRKGLFSSIGHAVVIATFAAVTLTAVVPAVAETGAAGKGLSRAPAPRDDTDFSARRRYHHGGGGAAAGAFAAVAGTGLAVAASQNRGAYADGNGNWECSPLHCGPRYYPGDSGYGYGGSSTPAVAW
jgi:hypothetical protein